MAESKGTVWSKTHIIDEFHRPRRPFLFVAAVLAFVLVLDAFLTAALNDREERAEFDIRDSHDVRRMLRYMADRPEPTWLLVGDSVLAGDVMAGKVDDWQEHRVIDYMRREKGAVAADRFYQIALNGLLPVDLLRIVTELDRIDPAGRIALCVELTVRDFSMQYAGLDTCTRAWLNDVGIPVVRDGRLDVLAWIRLEAQACGEWIGDHAPVFRHRKRIPWSIETGPDVGFAKTIASVTEGPGELEGMARIQSHYQDLDLSDANRQGAALRACVARFRVRNRHAVFFTTPMNDQFVERVISPERHGAAVAAFARVLDAADGDVRLVHLDAPLFVPALFLDHCHLFPEGNRLLAVNLLHALNVPLDTVPPSADMAYTEGGDATLVWSASTGCVDGAPWQARLDAVQGMAVDDGRRLIIADTNNHCIRALDIDLSTVRTIAGTPGQAGDVDGPAHDASFTHPRALCLLGNAAFVVDGDGARLRRIEGANVVTETVAEGPMWSRITCLRAWRSKLYLADNGFSILEYDPNSHVARQVVQRFRKDSIRVFDMAPDGRLFVVDDANRIWQDRPFDEAAETDDEGRLLFTNLGEFATPSGEEVFPMPFDKFKLLDVKDLQYVERYDGLLVQDNHPPERVSPQGPTETIHLRFFRVEDRMVYPWLKPYTCGSAYVTYNASAKSYVSPFRRGCMALDEDTGALFYAEGDRSRLFVMNDGLWGAAKISNLGTRGVPGTTNEADPLGPFIGEYTLANLRPDRFLDRRFEPLPRKGPYTVMMLGSSLTGTSDTAWQYSLGRAVERHLQDQFGYCDGIRLELLCRVRGGVLFDELTEIIEQYVANDARLDALLIEIPTLFHVKEEDFPGYLDRIRAAAERYDTKVILFDDGALRNRRREGPLATSAYTMSLLAVARAVGFDVIEPTDELVRESMDVAPWGCPPYSTSHHHASPWAIDTSAALFADRAYPILRAHFADRVPAHRRAEAPVVNPPDPASLLRAAFESIGGDWSARGLPRISPAAVLQKSDGPNLALYVDLGKLELDTKTLAQRQLDAISVALLYQRLVQDLAGARVAHVHIILATFANYDEYGRGVLTSAKSVFDREFDRNGLETYLRGFTSGPRGNQ